MKQALLVLIGLLVVGFANAQEQEVLENNPPSVKWQQVKTPNFKILYPVGFDEQALRVANTLEHIRDAEANSLGVKPKRISVILQNQSSISNGFVSILPRRSEFYTMPTQDYNFSGTSDWLNQLASHEYRHVVQFQRANVGFNRALYYMFGPATLAAMSIVAVPKWFWEGDAVATETAFSHSGRGRIPNFGLLFRTNLQEGRTFNYHKQYLRSYKHEIPDHYVLGYHMVSYLRKRTGDPNIWGKITKRAWSVPFIPFTFSNAIKNKSGLTVTQLYREMASDLKATWEEEQRSLELTQFVKISKRTSKAYTDYKYPQPLQDGSLLVAKSGIGDILEYTVINDGKENKAFTPGLVNDAGMLSAAGTKVVWTEYGFDPRWLVRNYSLIKVYDLQTNRYTTLTHKTRVSGAALSPDAKKIVTVESDNSYKVSVLVYDLNGDIVKRFQNPESAFYSMARWADDGKKIVVLKTKNNYRSIVALDFETGKEETLLSASMTNVGYPVLVGQYLLYNSPETGIDNIHALDISNQRKYQITVSKYGAYNAAVTTDGKILYYNEQSRDGLDVVSVPFDPTQWKTFEAKTDPDAFHNVLAEQENHENIFDSIPNKDFERSKYSKLSGLFNPYSWGAYFNSTFTVADIGISSRDILSTTLLKAGYLYDGIERTGSWQVAASYQGLYPIIDAQLLAGKREDNFSAFGTDVKFTWDETTVEGGLRIPLLLTKSKFHRQLSIGNSIGYTRTSSFVNRITYEGSVIYNGPERGVPLRVRVTDQNNVADTLSVKYLYTDKLNNGNLIYDHFSLSFYNLLKRSDRDFYSRWGQIVDVEYFTTPNSGDFTGNLFAIRSALFVPGFFKHHFLYGRLDYQIQKESQDQNLYTFRNRISKPRGYAYPNDKTFLMLSLNYAMPIWYPDIAIGPILNIQRVKTNFFYDYGNGKGMQQFLYGIEEDANKLVPLTPVDAVYKSYGVEVTFDINILRFAPKFEIGVRATSLTANPYSSGGTVFEFIIGNIGF